MDYCQEDHLFKALKTLIIFLKITVQVPTKFMMRLTLSLTLRMALGPPLNGDFKI